MIKFLREIFINFTFLIYIKVIINSLKQKILLNSNIFTKILLMHSSCNVLSILNINTMIF